MTRITRWVLRPVVLAVAVGVAGCTIKSPEAPSWDVDLTVPLGADTIRVADIIARTGSLGGDSVVTFSLQQVVPSTPVGDALALDAFSVPTVVTQFDTFTVSQPDPVVDVIDLSDISPVPVNGDSGSVPVPAFAFDPPADVVTLTGFSSATITEATLDVSVTNNLGMPVDQLQVDVTDQASGTPLFTWQPAGTLDTGATISQGIPLPQAPATSITLGSTLLVDVQGHTTGGTVTLGSNEMTVQAAFTGPVRATAATARVPAQTVTRTFDSSFSGNAQITDAHCRSGQLTVVFDNTSALSASVTLTLPQVTRAGSPVALSFDVGAHGSRLQVVDLAGCDYASSSANALTVVADIVTDPAIGLVTVQSTDALRVSTGGSSLVFDTMTGTIDPRIVTLSPVTSTIDVPEGADDVDFRHARATLTLTSTVPLPADLDLWITGHARDGSTVTLAALPGGLAPISLHLTPGVGGTLTLDETNSTILDLVRLVPESIEVTGTATIGDGTTIATISRTDAVDGSFTLDVPLTLSLTAPVTVKGDVETVTLTADTREEIQKRVRALRLIADIENTVPLGADITVVVARTPEGAADTVAVPGQSIVLHGAVDASTGVAHTPGRSAVDVSVDDVDLGVVTGGPMYVGTIARVRATAGDVSAYPTDHVIVRPRIEARAHIEQ